MIDSGTKLKTAERQQWFLELISQFKGALQQSSSPHKVLAKFRNFSYYTVIIYPLEMRINKLLKKTFCISDVSELFEVAVHGMCCMV